MNMPIANREQYLDPDYGMEKPICHCDICGGELYAGDYVTDIDGIKWCDSCIKDNRKCLEEDER